jgi:excisionase family DNA binding protein
MSQTGQKTPQELQLLTVTELANILRITPRYVRLLIESGEIPAFKLGKQGAYRIEYKDALNFLQSKKM